MGGRMISGNEQSFWLGIDPGMVTFVTAGLAVCQAAWVLALWRLKKVKGLSPPRWLVIVVALMLGVTVSSLSGPSVMRNPQDVLQTGIFYAVTIILLMYTLWLEWKAWHLQKAAGRHPSIW